MPMNRSIIVGAAVGILAGLVGIYVLRSDERSTRAQLMPQLWKRRQDPITDRQVSARIWHVELWQPLW
jgi:hypothetical protein